MAQTQLDLLKKCKTHVSSKKFAITKKSKKDGLRNIYCCSCKKYMTEFYVNRHLQSKYHFTKKHFGNRQMKHKRNSAETMLCKTPEKEYEYFTIQGDTIKKCKHHHNNILLEGCDDMATDHLSANEKVKQSLFQEEIKQEQIDSSDREDKLDASYIFGLPQNQLGLLDIDNSFDFQSVLLGEENSANAENAGNTQPFSVQTIQNVNQNEQRSMEDFPINLLSGVFKKEEVCHDFHHNQLSFYKCHICNPTTYKDYENW